MVYRARHAMGRFAGPQAACCSGCVGFFTSLTPQDGDPVGLYRFEAVWHALPLFDIVGSVIFRPGRR